MANDQRQLYTINLTCEVMRGGEKIGEHTVSVRIKGERGGRAHGIGDADHLAAMRDSLHASAKTVIDAGLSKGVDALTPGVSSEDHADAEAGAGPSSPQDLG